MPMGLEVDANPNKSVLQIAVDNHIEIRSICKGIPSCAECRVKVISGEQNMVPPNKAELALIGSSYYIESRRLSCQMHCYGEVVIDVSEHADTQSQTKKIRGFRMDKTQESLAVLDTMMLSDPKVEATADPVAEAPPKVIPKQQFRNNNQNQNQNQNKNQRVSSGGAKAQKREPSNNPPNEPAKNLNRTPRRG